MPRPFAYWTPEEFAALNDREGRTGDRAFRTFEEWAVALEPLAQASRVLVTTALEQPEELGLRALLEQLVSVGRPAPAGYQMLLEWVFTEAVQRIEGTDEAWNSLLELVAIRLGEPRTYDVAPAGQVAWILAQPWPRLQQWIESYPSRVALVGRHAVVPDVAAIQCLWSAGAGPRALAANPSIRETPALRTALAGMLTASLTRWDLNQRKVPDHTEAAIEALHGLWDAGEPVDRAWLAQCLSVEENFRRDASEGAGLAQLLCHAAVPPEGWRIEWIVRTQGTHAMRAPVERLLGDPRTPAAHVVAALHAAATPFWGTVAAAACARADFATHPHLPALVAAPILQWAPIAFETPEVARIVAALPREAWWTAFADRLAVIRADPTAEGGDAGAWLEELLVFVPPATAAAMPAAVRVELLASPRSGLRLWAITHGESIPHSAALVASTDAPVRLAGR